AHADSLPAWFADSPPASERELAANADAFVEVEVATVAVAQPTGTPVVLLRDPEHSRIVPIFIGPSQARSILRALRGVDAPRPMTHDLMGQLIGSLEARLARVYVDDLRDDTFLAMLELSAQGRDEHVRVDTRPSDAIALALRVGADIHVARPVIEATASIDYRGLEQEQVVTAAGITVMAPKPALREALDLPDRDGLVPMGFLERVRATPEGESVELRYWQDGEEATIEVPTAIPERPREAATPTF
ncbi:MAG: hypothetical protein BRD57_02515, partial [Proteobacteria bacterium SW_6_67_9]